MLMCSITAWADGTIAEMSVNGGTETPYATFNDLQAAINGLQNTDEAVVTLKKTVELTANDAFTFHVPAGKNVTLKLNGYNLTQTIEATAPTCHYYYYGDEITPSDPWWPGYGAPGLQEVCDEPDANADIQENALIYNQGTLHIISEGSSIVQLINTGSAEVDKATTICNAGNLTVDGGIFVGPVAHLVNGWVKMPVIWNKTEGATPVVNINGGTFLCDESRSDYNVGNLFPTIAGVCEMHIKGGIFSEDEMGADTKLNHPSTMAEINTKNADKANYTAILVPYTNANITGYNSATRTNVCPDPDGMKDATLYSTTDYKNKYRYAVKPVCMVIPTSADPDNFLYVSENTTITVPDGETLRVGAGGIVMGSTTTSKIIVEAGGTLISDKDIITSSYDNIELTMDAKNKKYSQLLIKPYVQQEQHPEATVVLKSKAYKMTATDNAWQRFAVPTYNNSLTRAAGIAYDATAFPTAIYRWDYTSANDNKWTIMTKAENRAFEPFECYNLSTNVMDADNRAAYTFKCELVGNGNANLNFVGADWNYFANSYTAPIDLRAFVTDLFENYSSTLFSTVYIHNIDGDGWDPVSWVAVEDDDLVQTQIQPMQAFVLYKMGAIDSYTIDYKNLIYNPVMTALSSSPAPARRTQTGIDYQRASVVITDENGKSDVVKFYEGAEFDSNINNGYDVLKLMNEGKLSAYIVAQEGKMAYLASDNIENATIAMQTKEATTYTLSFKNVTLEGYGVRDNLTGTTTEIKEGNTYHFSAPANAAVEGRFQVVAMPKITTAVENVENATATKGIYTLTGIYMGEDFNAVPAGIYIVNGKKMVK